MDPEFQKWLTETWDGLFPKITSAPVAMIIWEGEPDQFLALQIGAIAMLDKPLILCVFPHTQIPQKLLKLVDRVITVTGSKDPTLHTKVAKALFELGIIP